MTRREGISAPTRFIYSLNHTTRRCLLYSDQVRTASARGGPPCDTCAPTNKASHDVLSPRACTVSSPLAHGAFEAVSY